MYYIHVFFLQRSIWIVLNAPGWSIVQGAITSTRSVWISHQTLIHMVKRTGGAEKSAINTAGSVCAGGIEKAASWRSATPGTAAWGGNGITMIVWDMRTLQVFIGHGLIKICKIVDFHITLWITPTFVNQNAINVISITNYVNGCLAIIIFMSS